MGRKAKPLCLTAEEESELLSITKKGTHKSRKIIRARALLLMHRGKSKSEVMADLGIDSNHYQRIKARYLTNGLADALEERPRSGQPSKITERIEAQITSIACSDAPAGHARWSLSLIRDRLVELQCEEHLSRETIRKVLKKVNLNHG